MSTAEPKVKASDKLATLAKQEGFDSVDDMLAKAVTDSVCPGICIRRGCDYSTEVEPDCYRGWCEECNANTVRSALALAGII